MNKRKLLRKAIASPHNLRFTEFVALLEAFGFSLDRVKGDHHIFIHPDVAEHMNVQPREGQAKAYQVRNFLTLTEEYGLTMEE